MLTQRRGAVLRSDGSGQTPSGLQLSLGSPEEPPGAGEGDGSQLRPGAKAAPPARDPCKKLLPGGVGGCPRMLPPHPPPSAGGGSGSARLRTNRSGRQRLQPPTRRLSRHPSSPILRSFLLRWGKQTPPTHPPTHPRPGMPSPSSPACSGRGGGGRGGAVMLQGDPPGVESGVSPFIRRLPGSPRSAPAPPAAAGGRGGWGGGGGGGHTGAPRPVDDETPGAGGSGEGCWRGGGRPAICWLHTMGHSLT